MILVICLRVLRTKSEDLTNSKKQQKIYIIEKIIRDNENLTTNVFVSMHVTANKKRDVNPLLRMQVNEYGYNFIINHIQEI